MEENRCYNRYQHPLDGEAQTPAKSQKIETVNISVGGFCISSDEALEENQTIDLVLNLASGPISLKVRVIWSKPMNQDKSQFLVGVELLDSKSPDFERFYHYHCNVVAKN